MISCPPYCLFQKSLNEGVYQSVIKLDDAINLILKAYDPNIVSNYHPLTMLCQIKTIFNTFVLNSIRLKLNRIFTTVNQLLQ